MPEPGPEKPPLRVVSVSSMSAPPMPVPAAGAAAPSAPPRSDAPQRFPVVAPPVSPSPSAGATKPIHIRASGEAPEPTGLPAKPEQSRAFKTGVIIAVGISVLAAGVGGFFAWKHFLSPPAPIVSKPAVVKPAVTPAVVTTPAVPESTQPAPTPAEKTPGAVQPAPGEPTDSARLVIENPAAVRPYTPEAVPVAPATLAPGVTASMAQPVSAIDASPAFRAFVANAKIGGVFQGTPARALINGRTVHAGEIIDSSLGIMFEGIDPDKKQIIFRDRNDVLVKRKY